MTLIEVVAAIAILGTLLVGVVLAKSSHTRQLSLAQSKSQAVRLTDALIASWWQTPDGVPVDESGSFGPGIDLRWQTRVVDNAAIDSLGARVVRVEVIADDPQARLDRDARDDEPLLIVDLVVPDPAIEALEAEAEANATNDRAFPDALRKAVARA
ncbi:MAG: type II secretion system protein [Phycisphaeraceae bacterium]